MKVGDRVKVKDAIVLYNHPLHRNEPYDAQGLEGVVVALVHEWNGIAVSANYPVKVEFEVEGAKRPMKAHLGEHELEVVS